MDGPASDLLGTVALALLTIASLTRGRRLLRAALLLGGLLLAVAGWHGDHGAGWVLAAVMLALVNAFALLRMRAPSHPLTPEMADFVRRHLTGLDSAQARQLIDEGQLVDGQPGEVLTRVGEPVEHLYFLVSGCAAVVVGDAVVGRIDPGDLIGEACLLTDGRASATVRLTDPSRLWFVDKRRLGAFLDVHPRIAVVLQGASLAALRDKLERTNRASAGAATDRPA